MHRADIVEHPHTCGNEGYSVEGGSSSDSILPRSRDPVSFFCFRIQLFSGLLGLAQKALQDSEVFKRGAPYRFSGLFSFIPDVSGIGSENVSILIAFAAGIVSFISPCVLPLIPSYLTFITGVSVLERGID